jgi:hypothetical protein
MFRFGNERMAGWEERHEDEEPELYFCECADPDCRQKVRLEKPDYESVRADSRRFFVVAGHEIPDVETVVESHEGWVVIEKAPDVTSTVQTLDPRSER